MSLRAVTAKAMVGDHGDNLARGAVAHLPQPLDGNTLLRLLDITSS